MDWEKEKARRVAWVQRVERALPGKGESKTCPVCAGRGYVKRSGCRKCRGSGLVRADWAARPPPRFRALAVPGERIRWR